MAACCMRSGALGPSLLKLSQTQRYGCVCKLHSITEMQPVTLSDAGASEADVRLSTSSSKRVSIHDIQAHDPVLVSSSVF